MPSRDQYFDLLNRIETLRERLAEQQAAQAPDPGVADQLARDLAALQQALLNFQLGETPPPDEGLAQLIGLGPQAAATMGAVRVVVGVRAYDDTVTSQRLLAIADLYYIYQHERIGIFRAILKLQELFKSGVVRLSDGRGALELYQYDRKRVLRYQRAERMQAYRRVLGYTDAVPPAGSKPNRPFHTLFKNFNTQVARFFRDKRISEVVRPAGRDITFGSIAVVRRAGLDLRNNLKHASYGYVNVLAAEISQLLEAAFQILGAEDVRRLFGADNAWDTFEEIARRYLGEQIVASQRSRMGVTGRDIIRWLAQPHILVMDRVEFETLLLAVGVPCEEWLTSAQSLGLTASQRAGRAGSVTMLRRPTAVPA